ncbi:MAG: MASE1 domain-containing protein [Verrucomicrobiota bacterium]
MKKSGLTFPSQLVILIAFYFFGGLVGRETSFVSQHFTLLWPPAGIALAAILLFGNRFWPALILGAFLFGFEGGQPLRFTVGTALGTTIGALASAYLLKRFVAFRPALDRVRDVVGFVLVVLFVGASINALFSVVGLFYSGQVQWENLFPTVLQWWVPNALAGLVVAPLLLTWGSPTVFRWPRKLIFEALICATALIAGTLISFRSWYAYGIQNYPLAYLPYPFLIWGALRFGPRGAATGSALVCAVAIHSLLRGRGPFVMTQMSDSLMLLGSYLGTLSIGNLFFAALAAEREEGKRALFQSEKSYRAVVDDQTDLICRFDATGRLTFVNEAYCAFQKKSALELTGSFFLPTLSAQDREIPLAVFAALNPAQPTVSYDDKLISEEGKVIWQQCTVRALFDENNRPQEFQAVIHDVTTRKELEETLREREEFFRLISETMTDMVAVLDLKGNRIYNSPSYSLLLGNTDSLVGTNSFAEIHPDDQATIKRIFDETVSTGVGKRAEFRFVRQDGSIRFVESQASVITNRSGKPEKIVVVSRDITDRLSFETRLRQSQKMEAIGRLAGGISHDFNNLMQAIIGYSGLLLQRLPDSDANRDTIVQIEKSADRASALTGQLLAFSRKQVLQPKIFSLDSTVADVHKLLRRLIGENIQILTRTGQSGHVCADPGQIEQVVLNLSLNARDAMPNGGTLRIETNNEHLAAGKDGFSEEFQPGDYVRLSITDTGTGMSDEVKSHLFEPFFTTKSVGKGTGLGLSIVYGIVRQSGGEITLESDLGRGTTFHVFLPRVDQPLTDSNPFPKQPSLQETTGSETILLVEDEEIVREMLAEIIRGRGYVVLEARNGNQALELASQQSEPLHLLITDMMMPEMNGSDLARRLLSVRPSLPVLYISGYSDDEARQLGNFQGPAEFLQKPFRPDAILTRIREILDAKRNTQETSPP